MRTTRRSLLAGSAAGLLVAGFDLKARAWTNADGPHVAALPEFAGELTFEPDALTEAGSDFGAIATHAPWAVLRPAHAGDVVELVRFARRHRLKVAMRGQAHSVFGQAQAEGGVVIDSRTLNELLELTDGQAHLQAGVTWRTLVQQAAATGQTPPVLTDYVDLSIGGVLSVGGMGGTTHRHGMVVDTCTELTVVTGKGELVTCSETHRRQLFEAVLGGLGQFAIIISARMRLIPAKPHARVYQLAFVDLASCMAAQRAAVDDGDFDFVQGLGVPLPSGGFQFLVQLGVWYAPDSQPDDASLLSGFAPLAVDTMDLPYVAFMFRVDQNVAQWQAAGVWESPHPWSDLFVPDSEAETFIAQALSELSPADVGPGIVLIYPFKGAALTRPMVATPDEETLWLFDILRFAPDDPAAVQAMVDHNRSLFERGIEAGAKRYPISAVPMDARDWMRHYGAAWPVVVRAKARHDPRNTLTPGQRIFRR